MRSTRPKPVAAVRRGLFEEALGSLQVALRERRTQQSRYETAEVYEWMALAHRGLGREEAAAADAATADAVYAQLGAPSPGGLTRRERDVLTLIARWRTSFTSARRRWAGTWPTSMPRRGCPHAPPPSPGRASTTSCPDA